MASGTWRSFNGGGVSLVRCGDITNDGTSDALFRVRRCIWAGSRFKSGKAKKLKNAPRRFYRP